MLAMPLRLTTEPVSPRTFTPCTVQKELTAGTPGIHEKRTCPSRLNVKMSQPSASAPKAIGITSISHPIKPLVKPLVGQKMQRTAATKMRMTMTSAINAAALRPKAGRSSQK